jgi:DNA repair exonuclease SbcCD nuclease subunit
MKLAIISDLHFGIKNDNPFFLEEALCFFENQFFPYLIENKIDTILHLGDLLDRRKYVNFNTLSQIRCRFFEKMQELDLKFYTTIGNHDTYYRNTNQIDSISELFSEYSNVFVIKDPENIQFDGFDIGIVPWITYDNEKTCLDFIQNTQCSLLMGHFEINGFEVVSGIYHSSGIERNIFSKFETVLSGHFHIRQTKNNIHYVGTPYQLNFGDVVGKKGFNVFDTSTRNLLFVENKRKVFHVIKYDDINGFEKVDPLEIKNTFVKVLVLNKKKPKLFDSFIDILYSCELQELTVIEEAEKSDDIDTTVDMTQDTISIIIKEVDNMDNVSNKDKLKNILKELYLESMMQ